MQEIQNSKQTMATRVVEGRVKNVKTIPLSLIINYMKYKTMIMKS
jgi:hypothetical protein